MIKIDNFTTARCKECGWLKQFQPGKEYKSEDFECDCKAKDVIVQKIEIPILTPTPSFS